MGNYFIRNYPTTETNATAQTWGAMEDDRGIMYFPAGRKVIRYDGRNWTSFPVKGYVAPLTLAKGLDGTLFIGAESEFGCMQIDSLGGIYYQSLVDSLPENLRSFGRVWSIAVNDNGVYFSSDLCIFKYHNKELTSIPYKPFPIVFDIDEKIYFNVKDKGLHIIENDEVRPAKGASYFANTIVQGGIKLNEESILLLTGQDGLVTYNKVSGLINSDKHPILAWANELQSKYIYCITRTIHGHIAIGTIYAGIYLFSKDGQLINIIDQKSGLIDNSINRLYSDRLGNLWAGTDKGIAMIEMNNGFLKWSKNNGISGFVEDVISFNKEIYVATSKNVRYNRNGFFKTVEGILAESWQLLKHSENRLFVANSEGLYEISNHKAQKILDRVICYHLLELDKQNLIIGAKSGVFKFNINSRKSTRLLQTESAVRSLAKDTDGNIWYASENHGIGNIDAKGNIKPLNTDRGLPMSNLNAVFNFNHQVVIGTRYGSYTYDEVQDSILPLCGLGSYLCQDSLGLFRFQSGPKNDFWNSVYGDNTIRLNHNIETDSGYVRDTNYLKRAPRKHYFSFYAFEDGAYFSSALGLFKYDKASIKVLDQSYQTTISSVQVGQDSIIFKGNYMGQNSAYSNTQTSDFVPKLIYDDNELTFYYATPYFVEDEKLFHQYQLEGFDENWSNFNQDFKKNYTNLSEGSYRFKVRAKNIYGNISKEAVYAFEILPPWYRTWWAFTSYALLSIALVYLLIYLNVKRLKAANVKLESIVRERTAEVVQQKNEIEEKNELITSSINYAKTIQEAILTSDEFFKQNFKDHFVLYKPKDIVSGDFYWAHKTKSNKLFWVAADCTGHGVPGAFMTMIGNSLFNEIVIEKGIEETDLILNELRDQVIKTLNKELEGEEDNKMRNGMDLALCCWDLNTNILSFSGAGNPLFVIRSGELEVIKGDRQPIGLHKKMTPFTKHEYALQSGDRIYTFSDGYPDQMGGENDDRIKIKNLKLQLSKHHLQAFEDQKVHLDSYFENWRGETEQIDDVVVIGVEVKM